MGGPAWLADVFAGVMITVAAYCTSRLVVARWWRRPTDVDSDGVQMVMGVAMAGMLVTGLRFLSAGIWEAVFAAAAAWFAWRFIRMRRGAPPSPWRSPQPGPYLVECGAMLYMYLALPAVAVAANGAAGGIRRPGRASRSWPWCSCCSYSATWRGSATGSPRRPSRGRRGDRCGPGDWPAGGIGRADERHRAGVRRGRLARRQRQRRRRRRPGEFIPGPSVRRDVQDRHGHHHGLHPDPDALAGQRDLGPHRLLAMPASHAGDGYHAIPLRRIPNTSAGY